MSGAAQRRGGDGLSHVVAIAVERLPSSSFAIVMATGIVSIGLGLEKLAAASTAMLVLGAVLFVILVVLTAWRAIAFRAAFAADVAHPSTAFAFFTFVAAIDVLGTGLASWTTAMPLALLTVAALAWILMGYLIPWVVLSRAVERAALAGLNGSWFVWPVASQSVAVLAAVLQPRLHGLADPLGIVAIAAWGIGVAQYGIIGVAVVIRLLTRGIVAVEFGAPYWVMMGASAITVLAASRIVEMTQTPMVSATRAVIAGSSVIFWAFATWLVPALAFIGWWRHVRRRVPLNYESALWAMVFPLGMYAVASIDLGQADSLPVVAAIGAGFLWLAVVSWLVVAVAGIAAGVRALRRRRAG